MVTIYDLLHLPTDVGKLWASDIPRHPYKYGCLLSYFYETCEHGAMKNLEIVWRTLADAQKLLDDDEVDYAVSGSAAAVHYLGGRNTVADLGRRIVYTTRRLPRSDYPAGDEVIILAEDPLAAGTWKSGYASLAQTYADLWASPGWQAAEFTRALKAKLVAEADWEQRTSA